MIDGDGKTQDRESGGTAQDGAPEADRSAVDPVTLTSNTRREILESSLAFGGLPGILGITGRTGEGFVAGLSGGLDRQSVALQRKITGHRASIPLPPFIEPDTTTPIVDASVDEGASSVDIDVQLGTVGAIVSAASPKLGTDLSITESGEYRVTVTQSVEGHSTHSRRGDGVLVVLNYVYPRLCIENVTTHEPCVNGFPDLFDPPYPHARLYGVQVDDVIDLFGENILELIPWPSDIPDFFEHALLALGEDAVEELFDRRPSETAETIDRTFEIETTFSADAAHEYRAWQCFDVVAWALGKPDVEIQWGELLLHVLGDGGSDWDETWDWDGAVENRLEVECVIDDGPTVELIDDGPPPTTTGRVLTVTKDGAPEGRAAFYVTTDEAVEQAVDSEAAIVEATAIDWIGPESGEDNLHLRGDVDDFVLKGDATVYLDGNETSPDEFDRTAPNDRGDLSNTLTITKGDTERGLGAYAVTVSGELERTEDSEAAVRGRSAIDWVGPGSGADELRFSGEITTFVLKGDAEAYLNGERVYPPISRTMPSGGDTDTRTLTVTKEDANDGLGAYAVVVSGELARTRDSEATIDGKMAVDWVGPQTGTDTLHFTGDVEQFLLKGAATVYLDDEETDPGTLGSDDPEGTDDGDDLPNSLRVTKEGVEDGLGVYVVAVSESIAPGESSEAVIDGSYALDWVGPESGADELRYSGEIVDLSVKGQAAVYRNGERIDPDSIGGGR